MTEVDRDRYQFHDLIRDYATELTAAHDTAADRATATRRLLAWYLSTGVGADRLLYSSHGLPRISDVGIDVEPLVFSGRNTALNWYNAEIDNLLAVVPYAARQGHHDLAARLPHASDIYLSLRGRWTDSITAHAIGLASAQYLRDSTLELLVLVGLSDAYLSARMFSECASCCQRSLFLARNIGERRFEATALHVLGMVLAERGSLDDAADHYRLALPIYREVGNARGEAIMLCLLGDIRRQHQEFDAALDWTHQSLTIFRATGNRWNEAFCLGRLGQIHMDMAQLDQAIAHLGDAATIYREVDDRYKTARALHHLGNILHAAGHSDQAQHTWTDALALYEELNAPQAAELRDLVIAGPVDALSGPMRPRRNNTLS